MAAPKKFTRKRILEAASHLFWSRGYAATTVGEILEYAGANPGSFYFLLRPRKSCSLPYWTSTSNRTWPSS